MTEPVLAPSRTASVVLDIGGDVGALILHTPPHLDGVEIEISLNGSAEAPRIHSRVRERRTGAAPEFAAVYPGLAADVYTIWRDAVTAVATVTIIGGHVARRHRAPAAGRRHAGAGAAAG